MDVKIALVVLDATRTDYLGPYGGPPAATPTINRLAGSGIVFENCIAGGPWTPVSHATMFTGQYPSTHGARANDLTYPANGHYLPEVLSETPIRSQGIGAEPWLSRRQGVHRGFDRFHDKSKLSENLLAEGHHTVSDLPILLRAGVRYAAEKARCRFGEDMESDRFDLFLAHEWSNREDSFTFLNIPVAHAPYEPPSQFHEQVGIDPSMDNDFVEEYPIHSFIAGEVDPPANAWDDVRDLYTAGIAHADYLLSRAIEGLDDDTWIFLTADHGDHLGEYGLAAHMFSLSDELTNVPLIVSHPSLTPGRRSDVISHVDLAPTIYGLLDREGIDVPFDVSSLPGRSLFDDPDEDRIVFSEYGPPGPQLNALFNNADHVPERVVEDVSRHIRAAVTQEFKYLRFDDGEECLYRRSDETTDVLDDNPSVRDRLAAAMDAALDEPTTVDLDELDAYVDSDVAERLEHLGYA